MAVLDIVRIGESVLRVPAEPVGGDELASPGFQRFLDDLVETMRAANGAGLAAPQVGVSKRVFCVEVHENPRYTYTRTLTTWEGFRRWHEAAYAAEARAIVDRFGA